MLAPVLAYAAVGLTPVGAVLFVEALFSGFDALGRLFAGVLLLFVGATSAAASVFFAGLGYGTLSRPWLIGMLGITADLGLFQVAFFASESSSDWLLVAVASTAPIVVGAAWQARNA